MTMNEKINEKGKKIGINLIIVTNIMCKGFFLSD